MDWNIQNDLIGKRVIIFTAYDEEEEATVIGVSETCETIVVKADNGDILVGNQWEHAE